MEHREVAAWVAHYQRAWRAAEAAAVEALFTADAHYRPLAR